MDGTRLKHLIALKIAQSATPEELRELEFLLQLNPDYQEYIANIERIEMVKVAHTASNNLDQKFDQLWDKVIQQETQQTTVRKISYKKWLSRVAAVLIFILGLTWIFLYPGNFWAKRNYKTVHVPNGETLSLILPDGSKVKLNAGSTFAYPLSFKGDSNRLVRLNGEAFFDIHQDSRHPFKVLTEHLNVKVLGTTFNIKAYDNDPYTEATLLTGKIQVEIIDQRHRSIELQPNQKLNLSHLEKSAYQVVNLSDQKQTTEPIQEETAWLNHILLFENEPLEEIAKRIERRYDVKITFSDESLKQQKLSGTFKDETLDEALYILTQTTSFSYEKKGKTIHFKSPTIN